MRKRVLMAGLAVAVLAVVPLARAQAPAAPHADEGPALHEPLDAPGDPLDELFAFFDDDPGGDAAFVGGDELPNPAPGAMGAGGMGPGAGMHGGMGPGMHMGPMRGMGPGMGGMRRGMGPMGPRPGVHRVLAQLGLTDAQRQKLMDLHERQQRADIQTRADLQLAELDLRKAMRSEKPDKAAIDRQIDRIATLRASQRKAQVGTMLEARAVLTPEQLKKARELRMQGPRMQRAPGARGQQDDTRDLETPKR